MANFTPKPWRRRPSPPTTPSSAARYPPRDWPSARSRSTRCALRPSRADAKIHAGQPLANARTSAEKSRTPGLLAAAHLQYMTARWRSSPIMPRRRPNWRLRRRAGAPLAGGGRGRGAARRGGARSGPPPRGCGSASGCTPPTTGSTSGGGGGARVWRRAAPRAGRRGAALRLGTQQHRRGKWSAATKAYASVHRARRRPTARRTASSERSTPSATPRSSSPRRRSAARWRCRAAAAAAAAAAAGGRAVARAAAAGTARRGGDGGGGAGGVAVAAPQRAAAPHVLVAPPPLAGDRGARALSLPRWRRSLREGCARERRRRGDRRRRRCRGTNLAPSAASLSASTPLGLPQWRRRRRGGCAGQRRARASLLCGRSASAPPGCGRCCPPPSTAAAAATGGRGRGGDASAAPRCVPLGRGMGGARASLRPIGGGGEAARRRGRRARRRAQRASLGGARRTTLRGTATCWPRCSTPSPPPRPRPFRPAPRRR